jgi:uncharacterized protein YecT (DUF1311 family)
MNGVFKGVLTLCLCAIGFAWLGTAHAASFDCTKERTKVEKAICADPFISKLDSQLGKVYEKDLAKANPKQKKRLVTEELNWLKNMRDLCTTQTCFKHAYWERLAELETFYMPHSPMYAKASDKAAAIQKILKTAPLYPSTFSDPKKCRGIFRALKEMKGVEFVNPVIQVMSYSNPKLVPFRREVAKRDKRFFPQGAPLNFDYECEPNLYPPGDVSVARNGLKICRVYYGLPPFKLFEIPWGKAHSSRIRYIFYSDSEFGPMNYGGKGVIGSSWFLSNLLYEGVDGLYSVSTSAPKAGVQTNYNSLIKYKSEYYILLIYKALKVYWMEVDYAKNRDMCSWSPVK